MGDDWTVTGSVLKLSILPEWGSLKGMAAMTLAFAGSRRVGSVVSKMWLVYGLRNRWEVEEAQ
jgi:hypothetical protein